MDRKQTIGKRLDKSKPKIAKMAKKILPKVRKMEMERKKGKKSSD